MAQRFDEGYEAVTISSEEIVNACRRSLEQDDGYVSLAVVSYRGGQTEFDLGCRYAASDDPLDRVIGADVLSQLGWGDDCFHNESVEVLLRLLTDGDDRVIAAAAYAIGHRRSPRGIPLIVPLTHHPNTNVRQAAVSGLTGQNDPAAISGLITLAADPDRDVRNWAAFGLGTISDLDSREIREALVALMDDADAEIRGEALIGLAKRKDPRVFEPLVRELSGEFHGSWCLEAAELWAYPELLPFLVRLRDSVPPEDTGRFDSDFESAISACVP